MEYIGSMVFRFAQHFRLRDNMAQQPVDTYRLYTVRQVSTNLLHPQKHNIYNLIVVLCVLYSMRVCMCVSGLLLCGSSYIHICALVYSCRMCILCPQYSYTQTHVPI